MIVDIPNYKKLNLKYLILDYNGTIAKDGLPLINKATCKTLADHYKIYVLSGNTFDNIQNHLEGYALQVVISPDKTSKKDFVNQLGPQQCIAIGNGAIDVDMLKAAGLAMAVIGPEGCASQAILNADLVVHNIQDAFDIILDPTKLIASLKR